MPGLVLLRPFPRPLIALALVAVVCTALVGTAVPARAHDELVSSVPAAGERLATPPTEVTLTFSASVGQQFAQVAVVDDAGTTYQTGEPVVTGPTVTQAVASLPASGWFTVSYRVVSSDGHPIGGTVAFSVAAADETSPTGAAVPTGGAEADGASADGAGAAASDGPALVATPEAITTATDGSGGSSSALPWVLGGVVLLGAAALAVVAARRRRPSPSEPGLGPDAGPPTP